MLTIRDPRVAALGTRLANSRRTTMTEVVLTALRRDLRRERDAAPLATRLRAIAERARAMAGPNGRAMTRDEIDALSGQ